MNIQWRDRSLALSMIRKRLRLNRMALNQVRKRSCVKDEVHWAQHGTLRDTMSTTTDCSICQVGRKPRECTIGNAIYNAVGVY